MESKTIVITRLLLDTICWKWRQSVIGLFCMKKEKGKRLVLWYTLQRVEGRYLPTKKAQKEKENKDNSKNDCFLIRKTAASLNLTSRDERSQDTGKEPPKRKRLIAQNNSQTCSLTMTASTKKDRNILTNSNKFPQKLSRYHLTQETE